ncbi:MAG: helix-turn-helix transcriptional regulator [Bacteroides sp.]|nr:helix-turn-helix transcriptional regulator [Bacteroides sp.]
MKNKDTINGDTFSSKIPGSGIHIGSKICMLREDLGISKKLIAEKIGIEENAYNETENAAQIDDETLNKIAEALNIPAELIKKYVSRLGNNFLTLGEANYSNNYIGNMNVFIQADKEMVSMFLGFIKDMQQENKQQDQEYEKVLQEIKETIKRPTMT